MSAPGEITCIILATSKPVWTGLKPSGAERTSQLNETVLSGGLIWYLGIYYLVWLGSSEDTEKGTI